MSLHKNFSTVGVKVHFVGIGGIGMCGLAELLHYSGSSVTGSDLSENVSIKRLRKLGITIYIGHRKSNVQTAEIVVYSSAVPSDNVELRTARKRKVPVISRSEALSEVMRLKRGIVVAGTHGKTTTTGFLANIFVFNGKDPNVVVGGRSRLFQSTARTGKGEWFIAESDESDGGFKHLSPEIAVLTNIDRDHLDYYGSFKKLQSAFLNFVLKVPFYGCIVAYGDEKHLRSLLNGIDQKVVFYGFNKNNDFILKKISAGKYQVYLHQQNLGVLNIPLPGSMNALNALAAVTAAMTIGFTFDECRKSFAQFKGVDRRFQKIGVARGVQFYDDYAHHPTEVREVLSAFREQYEKKRLIVLFQPHRFSRTAACWQNFLTCFTSADQIFLTDIYPAGERLLRGISSRNLVKQVQHSACHYCASKNIVRTLSSFLKKGDVLITMGAGNVYQYGWKLLQKFRAESKPKKSRSSVQFSLQR